MDNITAADLKQVSIAIEEGYEFGFFPFYWELYIEDKENANSYLEDIADMVWQGILSYHLPCKWELKVLEDI